MFSSHIIRDQSFEFNQISVTHQEINSRTVDPHFQHQLDEEREKNLSAYHAKGIPAYDGTWYRVENLDAIKNGSLHFILSTIPHRYRDTLVKEYPDLLRSDPDLHLNNLSTGALLKTSDDRYVFGVRKKNGHYAQIGGGVQQDQLDVTTSADFKENLFKEIREETGIERDKCTDLSNLGIVQARTTDIITVTHINLNMSREQVNAVFPQRYDQELRALYFVRPDKLKQVLTDRGDEKPLLAELLDNLPAKLD